MSKEWLAMFSSSLYVCCDAQCLFISALHVILLGALVLQYSTGVMMNVYGQNDKSMDVKELWEISFIRVIPG